MRDVLQVVTRSGSGSAARALGNGLAGISTRSRRILPAAGAFLVLIYLAWNIASAPSAPPAPDEPAPLAPMATPRTTPTIPDPGVDVGRASYSIALNEVTGLGSGTTPGTTVDLWVAWDPPVTDSPKLHRLLRGAIVEQIAPPVTANGPTVAVLSVANHDVDELLWADRYGSLSAVEVPPAP